MSAPRGRALLLTCLFLGATIGAHAHRALEAHGYCSAHGELVHLPTGHRLPEPTDVERPSLREHVHLDGTHACAALELLAQVVDLSTAPSLVQTVGVEGDESTPPRATPGRSILLLHQAPKVSPPLV